MELLIIIIFFIFIVSIICAINSSQEVKERGVLMEEKVNSMNNFTATQKVEQDFVRIILRNYFLAHDGAAEGLCYHVRLNEHATQLC